MKDPEGFPGFALSHPQLGVVIADRVWAALGVGDVEVSSQA
ncbi:hypothetical protein [Synechococcus sp. M16.1]|nr:hypothetical protein [Synechococcus sp. M16.1]QNJ12256.1 hypothetical protein SynM161_02143 [Synechococcus sp. M16.1]